VGAIQLLRADESPTNVASIEGTSLDEGEVEELLLAQARIRTWKMTTTSESRLPARSA